MFFEPLLTGDVWWLVVNKRRRRKNFQNISMNFKILFLRDWERATNTLPHQYTQKVDKCIR